MRNEIFKWFIKNKQMMNTLGIKTGKDVSFIDNKKLNLVLSLFVSEEPLWTPRVRKGTSRSLPSGLLTPTVPCCIIYWAFTEIYVLWGLNRRTIDDWNSMRMRMILFVIRDDWKGTEENGLGWP